MTWCTTFKPSLSLIPPHPWRFRGCSHWRGPPPLLLPSPPCSVGDGVQTCSRCQRTWPRPTWSLRCGRGWAPAGWSETWGWAPSQPAFCGVERGRRDGGGSQRRSERVEERGGKRERKVRSRVGVEGKVLNNMNTNWSYFKEFYYYHSLILSYSTLFTAEIHIKIKSVTVKYFSLRAELNQIPRWFHVELCDSLPTRTAKEQKKPTANLHRICSWFCSTASLWELREPSSKRMHVQHSCPLKEAFSQSFGEVHHLSSPLHLF